MALRLLLHVDALHVLQAWHARTCQLAQVRCRQEGAGGLLHLGKDVGGGDSKARKVIPKVDLDVVFTFS